MTCENLCTASECAILRERIEILETTVTQLSETIRNHVYVYDIYTAHNWYPSLDARLSFVDSQLQLTVEYDGDNIQNSVDLSELLITDFSVDINELDTNLYQLQITINDAIDSTEFSFLEPTIDFETYQLDDTTVGWSLIYNSFQDQGEFSITLPENDESESDHVVSNLRLLSSYQNNILTLSVSDGESSDSTSVGINTSSGTNAPDSGGNGQTGSLIGVTIDGFYQDETLTLTIGVGDTSASISIPLSLGDSVNNSGEDDMSCQAAIQECCNEILAAIRDLSNQVAQTEMEILMEVQKFLDIPVIDTIATEYECVPETDENGEVIEGSFIPSNTPLKVNNVGVAGLIEYLRYSMQNQYSTFEMVCEEEETEAIVATPSWWQVRLGGDVPQLACVFRAAGTRTYHSLAIPHPSNTAEVTSPVLPSYRKGSWQGMVTCKDNSKFIINCETKAEAERMCSIAAQQIDSAFLDLPPRIYVGERKGQGVRVGAMSPTSVEYYSTGQRNTIPNWRARVSET